MSISKPNLATAKTILSAVGTITATAMVVRGVARDFLPSAFQNYIFSGMQHLFTKFSNQLTLVIDEFDGLAQNEIYEAAEIYLGQKIRPNSRRLKIHKPTKENHFKITLEKDQEIVDIYNHQKFKWVFFSKTRETRNNNNPYYSTEIRSFELTFHNKNKDLVFNSYLSHIKNIAKIKKQEKKTVKIFSIGDLYNTDHIWTSITLDHPATFDTLAMDIDQKEMILKDLERFVGRKEYYKRVGKAWKRGYLLYGPPGTGKSSLIAAMANYLNFDIYDLELTQIKWNSDLRRLLVNTANQSILIVEDIDSTIDLQDRQTKAHQSNNYNQQESQITLSGFLNFVDGLWSSCGDERIIIFTTNHVEKLDPALLRPGRMDVHVNMSYCTLSGFKILASNYLGINDHILFKEIADSIRIAKITPAEVAEQLLKNDDSNDSLQGLIDFIHKKIEENEEALLLAEKKKVEEVDDKQDDHDEQEDSKENEEVTTWRRNGRGGFRGGRFFRI